MVALAIASINMIVFAVGLIASPMTVECYFCVAFTLVKLLIR